MPAASPGLLALALAVVFAAGIVRGFAGFGFSAICVAGLSLAMPPAQVVPPVFVLEVLASLSLLRGALAHADWRWLSWLLVGNALFIPAGVALLAWLPETPLRLLIGVLLLAAAVASRFGLAMALQPTRGVRLMAGVVTGVFNGVAAIGGTALAVLLSTSSMPPAAMRATMIVLFLFTDLYALGVAALLPMGAAAAAGEGGGALLGWHTLRWALVLAPAMLAGIWVGSRSFRGVAPERFRRIVLDLLIVIAALAVLRAGVAMMGVA
ncbi:MAG: sulfite exporter TauE/SafE family protein [Rubrivivax sp.]|nr:sulfite exporter TauE/SafE family protein [Rubrivivax sp.]